MAFNRVPGTVTYSREFAMVVLVTFQSEFSSQIPNGLHFPEYDQSVNTFPVTTSSLPALFTYTVDTFNIGGSVNPRNAAVTLLCTASVCLTVNLTAIYLVERRASRHLLASHSFQSLVPIDVQADSQ